MPIEVGTTLQNRYRIERALSEHVNGGVYLAYDQESDETVVVKEFIGLDKDIFNAKAAELAKRIHPNLPEVLDSFSLETGENDDLQHYLVMEYVAGQNLGVKLAAQGPLNQADVYTRIGQVLAAVDYLHSRQPPLLHGDIKPDNIIVNPQGDAVLVDYGIAQTLNPHTHATLVAPEQVSGEAEPRSDVYAIGATLYMLLSGQVPGGKQVGPPDRFDVDPLRRLAPHIKPAVARVIEKALANKPSARYENIRELRKAYSRAHTRAVQKETLSRRRSMSRWLGLLVLLVVLMAATGAWFSQNGGLPALLVAQRQPTATPPAPQPATATTAPTNTDVAVVAVQPTATAANTVPPATATQTATATETTTATATVTQTATATDAAPTTPTETAAAVALLVTEVKPVETVLPGAEVLDSDDDMVMVFVPAGEFLFGSNIDDDINALGDEYPQLTIDLPEFWVDQHEVTNSQYFKCIMNGPCTRPLFFDSARHADYFTDPDYKNYPVIWVNWAQADTYCTWAGRQLPNELQWEKAARGTAGWVYSWGNTFPTSELANFGGQVGDVSEVGAYPEGASPYSALDMAGNVAEWMGHYYKSNYYNFMAFLTATPDPVTLVQGGVHAIRNGAWNDEGITLRVAARRYPLNEDYADNTVGFRCVSDMRPD